MEFRGQLRHVFNEVSGLNSKHLYPLSCVTDPVSMFSKHSWFLFLDSSLFGFCETDLQGASKSSGMFVLKLEFIAYIYLTPVPKSVWKGLVKEVTGVGFWF